MQASRTKTPTLLRYRIVASLALLPLMAACGYKGPLYMPPPPPDESLTTPPPASTPAPAAQSSSSNTQTSPVTLD